ncbi:N-acetylmuramoyl-L-alanine amidase [Chroococcus sp. FPU101]|uniref:N-acetylmuramoyl-L-alanine amidase n=1 Tax=Chroococcus sp. FPU101 TaxID=1974212 RepID=UPI001AA33508|nr:N-acetylmuramoyl-L-alanine amidase [Chroococcus sp. FPU101]GFE68900.1 cell wall hydrolase/autolysin [Chroococcus sp. FPU101]
MVTLLAQSPQPLYLAYPPNNHQTVAEKIFFIGSASPTNQVTINHQPIQRSKTGNFAPSFPLKMGENKFTIRAKDQTIQRLITRLPNQPQIPKGAKFAVNSLTPSQNITRTSGDKVCFSAIAVKNAQISVKIANQNITLKSQVLTPQLPPNSAVLTATNQSQLPQGITLYQGCTSFANLGNLGKPIYTITVNDQTASQTGSGEINIIDPSQVTVVEIISDTGVTRTGPSTDYSRLTPLPKGTKVSVTGTEGDWLRLDYGAWILAQETQLIPDAILTTSMVRGISSQNTENATEIIFPLENPVPIEIKQEDNRLILSLHNTVAQTDTIYIVENPLIRRLDWQQVNPKKVDYTFNLYSAQQWGYDVRYEGTSLIFSLRHPPQFQNKLTRNLEGISILLDPGHGGKETGAAGPTGYTEKEVNLVVSQLIKEELIKRGATVYMTRETDQDLSLNERVVMINKIKPTLAISVHYNALPDGGDAINTDGIGAFWYHPQAHNLAAFLHNYLTKTLKRPSYGVYWNNLALTRPHTAPSILLELGFMINPTEFEWIIDPQEQVKLASAIADGITEWLHKPQT